MIVTIPTICGSVAGKPSALGVKLHNTGYAALNLPFTYVAMGTDDIDEAIGVAKALGFRGLAVSMPHKQAVITRLDNVSEDVQKIGACNTVVFSDAGTTGYNTDWIGAREALREAGVKSPKVALIVGAGGVARAIAYALKQTGAEVFVAARRSDAASELVRDLGLAGALTLAEQGSVSADLVVNATPDATETSPLHLTEHPNAVAVFDVVFTQLQTPLISDALRRNLTVVAGWRMLLHQGLEQFRLYTGAEPPISEMAAVLEAAFGPAK